MGDAKFFEESFPPNLEYPAFPSVKHCINMTRKDTILIAVAVLLAAIYAYSFTDWLVTPRIQITFQARPFRPEGAAAAVHPLIFAFDRSAKLTSLKVVPLDAYETNKYATPVWHLISNSNSVPVHGCSYGKPIRGMTLAQSNSPPQKLDANRTYRLFIEAGKAKGQIDFRRPPGKEDQAGQ